MTEFFSHESLVEAALLTSSEGVSRRRLRELFSPPLSTAQLQDILDDLQTRWQHRALELVETAQGWRFRVPEAAFAQLDTLIEERSPRYSRSVLETLAIIAYQQPVTRSDIEAVRGVAVSTQMIQTLVERGWIESIGQRDTVGRPNLWATTPQFLSDFGLADLTQLPPLAELGSLLAAEEGQAAPAGAAATDAEADSAAWNIDSSLGDLGR